MNDMVEITSESFLNYYISVFIIFHFFLSVTFNTKNDLSGNARNTYKTAKLSFSPESANYSRLNINIYQILQQLYNSKCLSIIMMFHILL